MDRTVHSLDKLTEVVAPHVSAFDFYLDEGIREAFASLPTVECNLTAAVRRGFDSLKGEDALDGLDPATRKLRTSLLAPDAPSTVLTLRLDKPTLAAPLTTSGKKLFPATARESGINYSADLSANLVFEFESRASDGEKLETFGSASAHVSLGKIPIMVGSSKCHLRGLSPSERVAAHDDESEVGGYFLCNGIERVTRLLQIPRRNHIMAMERPSFANRGFLYTSKAVSIRCVGRDQTGATVTLHYLRDGSMVARLGILKAEYFIPAMILLRALRDTADREIFRAVVRPGADGESSASISRRLENSMLDASKICARG